MAIQALLGTIGDYRQWLYQRGHSGHTLNAYVSDVRGFFEDHNRLSIQHSELENMVAAWLNVMRFTWAAKTTQRKLTSLRSYAMYLGVGEFLPYYTLPKAARSEPSTLEGGVDDVIRMIGYARNDEERALVALLGLCGMRIGEALRRRPHEFIFKKRVIKIVRGKGMKDREVPMSTLAHDNVLDAVVNATLEGHEYVVRMSDRVARRCITRLGRQAGIPGVASHMLRATFATEAYEVSKDIVAVQDLLGHANITTTRGYVGGKMDAMRAAVEFTNRPKIGA